MKSKRQAKIMEIISTTNVETQEQLLQELEEAGFRSTQATMSRDIKELRVVKELTSLGTYRYTTSAKELPATFSNRLNTPRTACSSPKAPRSSTGRWTPDACPYPSWSTTRKCMATLLPCWPAAPIPPSTPRPSRC